MTSQYPSQRLHLVTMTPLSLAIHARRHEVVEVLLKYVPARAQPNRYTQP